MGKLGKGEFINEISDKSGVSKKDVTSVFEAMVDVITENLVAGNKISLVGFGNYSVSHRAARKGVNPSTGESLEIPEKDVPKFSFSSNIKKALCE